MTTPVGALDEQPAETGRRVPGEPDMWFFVFFESLLFTAYFCVYLFSRTQHERLFLQTQSHLSPGLGVLDTIVLLTSSWAVAGCVRQARAGQHRSAMRLAFATAGLGALFLALKMVEWVRLIHLGYTFSRNDFTQYYFFLTGIHAIHVLIGFVALGVLLRQLSDPARHSQQTVETCATYWHTVDVFWVLIFAMLYVVR
jgi:nitric oxide reductase NorE protein